MTRHIHADCIIAWAGGAKIQWRPNSRSAWEDLRGNPGWMDAYEYRVRPEPEKVEYRLALLRSSVDNRPFVHAKVRTGVSMEEFERSNVFIRWLGDPVVVEV